MPNVRFPPIAAAGLSGIKAMPFPPDLSSSYHEERNSEMIKVSPATQSWLLLLLALVVVALVGTVAVMTAPGPSI